MPPDPTTEPRKDVNRDDARLVDFGQRSLGEEKADYEARLAERLTELNREERRKNGTEPWVAIGPKAAAVVRAGHAAMKEKKRRRKIAAASRARNR